MVCLCICFPGETKVATEAGEKRMDELKLGDKVQTFTSKKRGVQKLAQSLFYNWGHREPDRVAEFVVIKVCGGKELQISSNHLLFVVGEEGKRVAIKAGQVCAGDKLFHLGENQELELATVIEINVDTFTGVFAPFTMSGNFFANRFLVSCYANVDSHSMAHSALAPLRAWYQLRMQKHPKDKANTGIHGYAKNLMKFRDTIPAIIQKQIFVN